MSPADAARSWNGRAWLATKPILADKIRYYEEPSFKARTGDYFHGVPAAYEQRPGAADLLGPASIDWRGVRAFSAPSAPFAGVRVSNPLPQR